MGETSTSMRSVNSSPLCPPRRSRHRSAVRGRLARPLNVSIDRELDFVGALHSLHESGALDRAGVELWRVGLIADERATSSISC